MFHPPLATISLAALAVLGSAPAAAVQSPFLGAPRTLPGDLSPGEAGGVQQDPQASAGGAGSLAVWVDHRAEHHDPLANEGSPDVFAMRLDALGQPLDPVALRMPRAVGDKLHAKAAWNGSAWLVTWENQQPLGTSSFQRLVLGARVAADGRLLDGAPIVIKDDFATTGSTTAVASDGMDWVVVAQGTDASAGAVVAVRVTADGQVANPGGTVVASLSVAINRPDLAYADGRYLLVWAAGHVRGLRFDQALAPLGTNFAIGTGSSAKPRVAADGQDFLVVWENADFGRNVRARRVGGVSGAQSAVIQVTPLSNFEYHWEPDVAWNGSLWHVAFTDTTVSQSRVYRQARIDASLALLDPGGVPLPVGSAAPDGRVVLAPAPGGVTAVFERADLSQPWPGEILAVHVDDTLASSPPLPLSLSAPRHGEPAMATGDGQVLVAYASESGGAIRILVQRLDASGAAIDLEPIEVASGSRYGEPDVAWNGDSYLVVWEDPVVPYFETDDRVLGLRVAMDGSILDLAPVEIMEGSSPAVAAQGDTFLVVSSAAPSTDELRYPLARRVAADGRLLGSAVPLGGTFSRYPDVAPLGSGWVVTWQRNFTHDNPNSVARAALVAFDGSASPDFLVDGQAGFGGAARPVVASAGDRALLVWQDDFHGLAGRLVLANGTLSGSFPIAPPPAAPAQPAVAWNGAQYTVVWRDFRSQVGLWDYRTDVWAARVRADGVLIDDDGGFPVARRAETELFPAVTGVAGSTLFAFVEFLPAAPHATLRVRLAASGASPAMPPVHAPPAAPRTRGG